MVLNQYIGLENFFVQIGENNENVGGAQEAIKFTVTMIKLYSARWCWYA